MSLNSAPLERLPDHQDRPTRRRRTWRRGGSSTARWGAGLAGISIICLGLAVISAVALPPLLPAAWGTIVTAVAVWTFLAYAIVRGLSRSIPRGLFRFKPLDLLYGLALGILVRLLQGLLETATTGAPPPFPSYPTIEGSLPVERWLTDGVTAVLMGPLVEELFFRGVLLVSVYTVARRRWNARVGGCAAVALTTVLFAAAHALIAPVSSDQAVALLLLGLVCGLLVVRTGRLWGAVLVHVVYNATLVFLIVAGTLFA